MIGNYPMWLVSGLICGLVGAGVGLMVWRRQMHLWLWPYLTGLWRRADQDNGTIHVILCIADHYEPAVNGPQYEQERARVATWVGRYPSLAAKHCDADGIYPQHTFFYPEEQYREEHLDDLATLCRQGYGDVEIHLHHDRDTAEGVREKLNRFRTILHRRHGLLHFNAGTGQIEYGFIHGNWALDNSGPGGKYCGVNNELTVLRETGCYADFTLPSAPEGAQTRKINSIYYATDDPTQPKSHNDGTDVSAGGRASGDLMIIQGPLSLNWTSRKWGVVPRIENGELSKDNPPTPARADLWVRQAIHVQGRPDWVFVKLHCHGALEEMHETLLGPAMDDSFTYLETKYNDGRRYCLHYVTAREMYNIIKAAEAGAVGNPHPFRGSSRSRQTLHQYAEPIVN